VLTGSKLTMLMLSREARTRVHNVVRWHFSGVVGIFLATYGGFIQDYAHQKLSKSIHFDW